MSLRDILVRLAVRKHLMLDLRPHYCTCKRCRKVWIK